MSDEKYGARGSVLSKRTNFRVGGVMEKVSAMKKVALFMMTKRVARPMKFAAFISIIISVVVLFAACQAGPAGQAGADGKDGQDGVDGVDGNDGLGSPQALPSIDPILINDVQEDGSTVAGAVPTGLNASSYFRGGKAPIKYKADRIDGRDDSDASNPMVTAADNIYYDLKVDKDTGAITIEKLAVVSDNNSSEWYAIGDSFSITAEDADGFKGSTSEIWVKRNRAPTAGTLGGVLQSNTDEMALVVGNQPGMPVDPASKEEADATADSCDDLNTQCVSASELAMMFTTTDGDDLTYVPRSKNPTSVSVAADSDGLIITGHQPVLDDGVAQNVSLFFKAVDGNDLASAEHTVFVVVDPMPVISGLPTAVSVKKAVTSATVTEDVIGVMTEFITNKDGANVEEAVSLSIVAADGTASTQTITTPYFIAMIDQAQNLDITTRNVGSQSITILVEEDGAAPIQWLKHEITITVTN